MLELVLTTIPPTPTFNPDDVTPGPIGFFMTALLFLAVGVLAWLLIRRVSRYEHRMNVREQLEAEQAAAEQAAQASAGDAGDAAADGRTEK